MKRINTNCKDSASSNKNNDHEDYYNELNKLQEDIYKKHISNKK